MLGYNYGKVGMMDEAKEILDIHLKRREVSHVPAHMIATIYIGMGDTNKALDWLEIDTQEGGQGLFHWGLKTDPKFDELSNHDRFKALVSKFY